MPSVLGEHAIGRHTRRADPTCPKCHPDQPELQAGFGMPVDDSPQPAKKPDPSPGGPTPRRSKAPAPSTPTAGEPVTEHIVYTTREQWLVAAVEAMRPMFPAEHPVPDVRVSVGWPAGRGSSRLIGQCWYETADKAPALFVSPELDVPARILDVLAHEMVHAATPGTGHKGAFIAVARAIGLVKPWRATTASPELVERLTALAASLGAFPHSKVNKGTAGRPTVQTTRQLKVTCADCGCIVRMTRKWLDDAGTPLCGCGGLMSEEVA